MAKTTKKAETKATTKETEVAATAPLAPVTPPAEAVAGETVVTGGTKTAALKTLKERGVAAAIRLHPDHEEAITEQYGKMTS